MPQSWKAVKTVRCGEPGGSKKPPKEVEAVMVKHLGEHARLFEGGVYPGLPAEVVKVLEKAKLIVPA